MFHFTFLKNFFIGGNIDGEYTILIWYDFDHFNNGALLISMLFMFRCYQLAFPCLFAFVFSKIIYIHSDY